MSTIGIRIDDSGRDGVCGLGAAAAEAIFSMTTSADSDIPIVHRPRGLALVERRSLFVHVYQFSHLSHLPHLSCITADTRVKEFRHKFIPLNLSCLTGRKLTSGRGKDTTICHLLYRHRALPIFNIHSLLSGNLSSIHYSGIVLGTMVYGACHGDWGPLLLTGL
jgi:hypothetical protein